MCGVSDISADTLATVHGIVVSVSLEKKGGHFEGGKRKQDVEVADESKVSNVVLWEEDINKLEDGALYQLNRFKVRSSMWRIHSND